MVYETFTSARADGRRSRGKLRMERAVFDRMAELDQHHWWFIARRRILEALIERVVEAAAESANPRSRLRHRPQSRDARRSSAGSRRASSTAARGRVANKRLPRKVKEAQAPRPVDVRAQRLRPDRAARRARACAGRPRLAAGDPSPAEAGGALLLTVPANPWMWSAHDAAHHHFRRYTKKQLERAVPAQRARSAAAELFQHFAVPARRRGAHRR